MTPFGPVAPDPRAPGWPAAPPPPLPLPPPPLVPPSRAWRWAWRTWAVALVLLLVLVLRLCLAVTRGRLPALLASLVLVVVVLAVLAVAVAVWIGAGRPRVVLAHVRRAGAVLSPAQRRRVGWTLVIGGEIAPPARAYAWGTARSMRVTLLGQSVVLGLGLLAALPTVVTPGISTTGVVLVPALWLGVAGLSLGLAWRAEDVVRRADDGSGHRPAAGK